MRPALVGAVALVAICACGGAGEDDVAESDRIRSTVQASSPTSSLPLGEETIFEGPAVDDEQPELVLDSVEDAASDFVSERDGYPCEQADPEAVRAAAAGLFVVSLQDSFENVWPFGAGCALSFLEPSGDGLLSVGIANGHADTTAGNVVERCDIPGCTAAANDAAYGDMLGNPLVLCWKDTVPLTIVRVTHNGFSPGVADHERLVGLCRSILTVA